MAPVITKKDIDSMLRNTLFDDMFGRTSSTLFDHVLDCNSMLTSYGGQYNKENLKVDVIKYEDRYELEADLSGLEKDDVSAEIEGDFLTIRGEKKQTTESNNSKGCYIYKEIKRSSLVRSFSLGDEIDKDKVKANFQNGILKIILPRINFESIKSKYIKLL